MSTKRRVSLRGVLFLPLAVLLIGGCVKIQQPASNATGVPSPVQALVTWGADMQTNTFFAKLDGNDVTAQFNVDYTNRRATGSLTTTAGPHSLQAGGKLWAFWAQSYQNQSTTNTFSVTGPPPPPLSLSPSSLTVAAGASGTATVSRTNTGSAITITLAPSNNTVALGAQAPGSNDTAGMTAGQGTQTETIRGNLAGQATVTASAPGFQSASMTVQVDPVLSSLSPSSGAVGSTVSVTGNGFASGATVQFGGINAITSFGSATQLTATVPTGLSGMVNVVVQAAGRSSNPLSFAVAAAPVSMVTVFRSSATDVQSFNFTNAAAPSLIDTRAATPSSGAAVVGLAFNGSSFLLRASSVDVQAYSVSGTSTLSLGSTVAAASSGTGAAAAARGTKVIRASNTGLQAFDLSTGALQARGSVGAVPSSTGVGVDLDAGGTIAVRAHSTGVEVFNVGNLNSLTLLGSTSGVPSSTGTDVRIFSGTSRAVRVHSTGIEVFNIATAAPPTLLGSGSGAPSSTGVAVAVNGAGTRAVRAHSTGIEVFDITNPASITLLGSRGGAPSSTGVGIFLSGNIAVRGMNTAVEAFDISNPASIQSLGSIAATPSSTGVGLAGK
jgi:hypothetical protein